MSGGGKGGSTTSKVEIPAWLEQAAQSNLAKAGEISKIGYTPYYGPDVAAMTPSQVSAMQGTNQAASAFGMPTADPTAGMPAATNYGGMSAYSSAPMYEQSLAALKAQAPGQYAALQAPFINPVTGAQPAAPFGFGGTGTGVMGAAAGGGGSGSGSSVSRPEGAGARAVSSGTGRRTTSIDTIGSYAPGGVNTRNPGSRGNRVAASLSGKQGAPTAADRPVSRSSGSGGKSGGKSGGSGGKSGGKSGGSGGKSGGRSESRR